MSFPPEGQTVEHKASFGEWDEAMKSLAAMANADGGTVHIGVHDDGTPLGIELGKGKLERCANDLKQRIDPPVYPTVQSREHGDKVIVSWTVEPSPFQPVEYDRVPYKRVGKTDQAMRTDVAQELRERTFGRSWDALPCEGMSPSDIGPKAYKRLASTITGAALTDRGSLLETLGLVDGGRMKHAGCLLLASVPARWLPNATVRVVRLEDESTFLEPVAEFDGPLIDQIERTFEWIVERARRVIIGEGIQTRTSPIFPDAAVREAVINALSHRDYRASGPTLVKLYPNRLDISNPGELPEGLSVEALFRPHPSRPRNRVLARALAKAKIMDEVGTGTLRIKREMDAALAPPPEFLSQDGSFSVRLWASHQVHPALATITERQRSILRLLAAGDVMSVTDLATRIEFGRGTLLSDLKTLQNHGFVDIDGRGRAARWRILLSWQAFFREWLRKAPIG